MRVDIRIRHQNPGGAFQFRSRGGGGGDPGPRHQNIDRRAKRAGGGQRLGDGIAKAALGDIGEEQR